MYLLFTNKKNLMMEREFVSYEQAVALKELGFDEMCFGFYNSISFISSKCKNSEPWMGNEVVAGPLKQQVFRWFREKYDYVAYVRANESSYCWCIQHQKTVRGLYDQYNSYEEAENNCISKLLELAKQQDK